MNDISIMTAFLAGLFSFFAPCVLPLIPPYFAWLLGIGQRETEQRQLRFKIFLNALILILGFSVVFILLGIGVSSLGKSLSGQRLLLQRIGGIVIIIFGLEFIGFLKIFKNFKIDLIKNKFAKITHRSGSLLIGLTFGFAWVACFSPILGSILVFAAFQETASRGVLLLSFYSLGLAIPFLLVALFLEFFIKKLKHLVRLFKWLNLFAGLILVLLGILLVSDNFYRLVSWLTIIL